MNSEGVYYSLNDVAELLYDEGVLTHKQSQLFKSQCQANLNRELARAYKHKLDCDHLQPIILPYGDYFIHTELWENLLILLPKSTAYQAKISYLSFMLSEADSVYRYPGTFHAVDLICLTRQVAEVKTLPGPLILEKRDN